MGLCSKTIALDAMGGDFGPEVVVPAAIQALCAHPGLQLVLVGQQARLAALVGQEGKGLGERLVIHHAAEVVAMDESPAVAMRTKKDSSMRVALNLVKSGAAQACVSAGNTGALVATARFVLKTLPGVSRPAIVTTFPTRSGRNVHVLDLGANVDATPEHLYQFAVMGSILSQAADNIAMPRVALLNIGEEAIKGNQLVKQTTDLLLNHKGLHYVGYVEADKLFNDLADVVVCDGFVGNVMLKTIEGVVKLLADLAREEFLKNIFTTLSIIPAKPSIKRMMKRMDLDKHNGAALLGLNGIVIKSHGGTSVKGFVSAIEDAILETEKNIPDLIKQRVADLLEGTVKVGDAIK